MRACRVALDTHRVCCTLAVDRRQARTVMLRRLKLPLFISKWGGAALLVLFFKGPLPDALNRQSYI